MQPDHKIDPEDIDTILAKDYLLRTRAQRIKNLEAEVKKLQAELSRGNPMTQEEYKESLDKELNACPRCRETFVATKSHDKIEVHKETLVLPMSCMTCGHEWQEDYDFRRYD